MVLWDVAQNMSGHTIFLLLVCVFMSRKKF